MDKLSALDYLGVSGSGVKMGDFDFNNLLIHIMEKEIREQYDLIIYLLTTKIIVIIDMKLI